MASRKDIKNAFLSELESSVSGLVPASDVYHARAERDEVKPAVTYDAFGRQVFYNNGSEAAPITYSDDGGGNYDGEVYGSWWVLRFDVTVIGDSLLTAEDIYEAVVTHFTEFSQWRDSTDIHADCIDVSVVSDDGDSDLSTEPLTPVERVGVECEYRREVTRDGEPIDEIHSTVDGDNDGTVTGVTRTTDTRP